MACETLPKLWISDEDQAGLRAYSLKVELPEGCRGTYELALTREQNGNRSATRQSGQLPETYGEDVTLSRVTINDPEAATIEARLVLNSGLEILHTVKAAQGSK